jgi:hypothetical protein
MATLIKFTDQEISILLHRFTIPECIAEALTDHADDEEPIVNFPTEYVQRRAEAMSDELTQKRQLVIITDLDREILVDAIEGSTLGYIIMESDDFTMEEKRKKIRTLRSIEKKVRDHNIETTGFPV